MEVKAEIYSSWRNCTQDISAHDQYAFVLWYVVLFQTKKDFCTFLIQQPMMGKVIEALIFGKTGYFTISSIISDAEKFLL